MMVSKFREIVSESFDSELGVWVPANERPKLDKVIKSIKPNEPKDALFFILESLGVQKVDMITNRDNGTMIGIKLMLELERFCYRLKGPQPIPAEWVSIIIDTNNIAYTCSCTSMRHAIGHVIDSTSDNRHDRRVEVVVHATGKGENEVHFISLVKRKGDK